MNCWITKKNDANKRVYENTKCIINTNKIKGKFEKHLQIMKKSSQTIFVSIMAYHPVIYKRRLSLV